MVIRLKNPIWLLHAPAAVQIVTLQIPNNPLQNISYIITALYKTMNFYLTLI